MIKRIAQASKQKMNAFQVPNRVIDLDSEAKPHIEVRDADNLIAKEEITAYVKPDNETVQV